MKIVMGVLVMCKDCKDEYDRYNEGDDEIDPWEGDDGEY